PVAIYDKSTLRVLALHSCALTNTPRSNNQRPITEQVAAKIIAACWPDDEEGGSRVQWIDLLMQFLSGRYDSTPAQKIEMLRALIEARGRVDAANEAAQVSASAEAETILDALGLLRVTDAPIAHDDVIAALGLEGGAELPAVVARIGEMKTGVITRGEHESAV